MTKIDDLLVDNFEVASLMFIGWLLVFFVRTMINNKIYNDENETEHTMVEQRLFRRPFELSEPGELKHSLLCVFTIWFYRYKPENRKSVLISNLLSIYVVGMPLAVSIWLFVSAGSP